MCAHGGYPLAIKSDLESARRQHTRPGQRLGPTPHQSLDSRRLHHRHEPQHRIV